MKRTICVLVAIAMGAMTLTGCLAGNYGMTRKLARWNLSFSPVPRVIIYIGLWLLPAYEFTILFDVLLNNTVDFWSGSPIVTAENQVFHKDGFRVVVNNRRDPLRHSTFTVYDKAGCIESVSELRETKNGAIDIYVNGELKAEVHSLKQGLAEISVMNPSDPQIISLKAPEQTRSLDFAKLRYVRKLLSNDELVASH